MNTEIIVALIASAGGILGAFVGVIASAQLTTYRIQQLEKKVDVSYRITCNNGNQRTLINS